jgi:hypothetical protein
VFPFRIRRGEPEDGQRFSHVPQCRSPFGHFDLPAPIIKMLEEFVSMNQTQLHRLWRNPICGLAGSIPQVSCGTFAKK